MNAISQNIPVIIHEADDYRLRLAKPEDNQALCALFRDLDMDAELRLTEERDPNFFGLHQLHLGTPYTVVLEDTSPELPSPQVVGCCSVIVRDGWYNGQRVRIGYSGDLRVLPTWRKARVFPLAVKKFTRYLEEKEGVQVIFCAMMRENIRAKGARLLAKGKLFTAYNMVNIQITGKVKAPVRKVERATEKDIPELAEFLARKSESRTFGYLMNESMLRERLSVWPDFSIENFFLIRNESGRIIACTAPYDTEKSVRRTRVIGYAGRMVALRKLYNAEALLRGFVPLPKEGECFHYVSLTHFEVDNDDPSLCTDLLRGVYTALQKEKLHFIGAFVPEGSPIEKSFSNFRTRKIPMDLYTFVTERSAFFNQDLSTMHPGYEMALH